tara:strand:- start:466 stop:657 length:192 start_codon:yes stop_codon:yes gene_type:complete
MKYLNNEAEQFHTALALAEDMRKEYRIQLAVLLMAEQLCAEDVKQLAMRLFKLYQQLIKEQNQ